MHPELNHTFWPAIVHNHILWVTVTVWFLAQTVKVPKGVLKDADIKVLSDFFVELRDEGNYFVQKMKTDFSRKRPYLSMKDLNPCVRKEVTPAYPSGHAAISRLYALVLGDLYPQNKSKFAALADEIGQRRVISGVHYPTDVKIGQQLADSLYKELQKSEKYKTEFKKYFAKISK
jgi:acid phosphatase (class A)